MNFTNFTFMVGKGPVETPAPPWSCTPRCPSCSVEVMPEQRFCRECGMRLTPKRDWLVVGAVPGAEIPVTTEEEAPPRPMKDVRLPKSSFGKTSKPGTHMVAMRPLEAMAALDNLTKEEKKNLRRMLQKEEEEAEQLSNPQLPVPPRRHGAESMSAAASSTPWPKATSPLAPTMVTSETLRPPSRKDERGGDKASGVRKRELDEFRHELWRQSWDGNRTHPSGASPMPSEKQARCVHAFDQLIWVSNHA